MPSIQFDYTASELNAGKQVSSICFHGCHSYTNTKKKVILGNGTVRIYYTRCKGKRNRDELCECFCHNKAMCEAYLNQEIIREVTRVTPGHHKFFHKEWFPNLPQEIFT